MQAQAGTRGITDPQFLDHGGFAQSAQVKIAPSLREAWELLLIESASFLPTLRLDSVLPT
jgi:hypothetical protein